MPVTSKAGDCCKMSERKDTRSTSQDDLHAEINHILSRLDRAAVNTGERVRFSPGRFASPRNRESALQELERRIGRLREMNAPLLVLGGALAPLAWLLNLPIRLLCRKQIKHNREVIEVLTGLAEILREQGSTGAGLPGSADR